jgi:hypothetical protein
VPSLRDPGDLSLDEIEAIERQSLRALFHAGCDFGFEAWDIFHQSQDDVKDIAEDITREMLDRLGGYQIARRILGNVDYRKARYIILPDFAVQQALFVDSKAEKTSRVARLQTSQLSMEVRQRRGGAEIRAPGKIPRIATYEGVNLLTTVLLAHYEYEDAGGQHLLKGMTLAALPNGLLQERYNPTADSTIWRSGPNAPSRGEGFRTRLSFPALAQKAGWRVQRIEYKADRTIAADWVDLPGGVKHRNGEDDGSAQT